MNNVAGAIWIMLLVGFALYIAYLLHTYPHRKLERIRELVQELDELIGIELFGYWTSTQESRTIEILNELKELLDD